MSEGDLLYELKQGSAWMIINRETRGNAINLEIINQFIRSLDLAEADEEVRVVCITGSGDRVFCSGADLATSFSGQDYVDGARKYATLLKKMAAFPKPLVARVNGNCLAGGLGLMLSCDMVYAREGAKFGTPEVNVGLFPMMIGALIFRNCLRKKALEMIYTGNMISAVEAENMGLITRALPPEQFESAVDVFDPHAEKEADQTGPAPGVELPIQALPAVEAKATDDVIPVHQRQKRRKLAQIKLAIAVGIKDQRLGRGPKAGLQG